MTKTLKWLLAFLGLVIIIGGGFTYWYVKNLETKDETISTTPSPAKSSAESREALKTTIEPNLLSASYNKNNFSIGYLKSNIVSKNWWPKAFAEDKNPETAIFFYAVYKNYLPQIYYYSLEDNQESQLTKDEAKPADRPVFSSIGQKLAYRQYLKIEEADASRGTNRHPAADACQTVIFDFETSQIIKTIESDTCIQPISWSPDGQKLALMEKNNNIKVFNLSTQDTETFTTPSGTTFIYGIRWIDDQNLTGSYFDGENKPVAYKINLASGLETLTLDFPNPNKIDFSNQEIFYETREALSSVPNGKLAKENIEGNKEATIYEGTDRLYDFLLALNEGGVAKTAVISQANPSSIISVDLSNQKLSRHKDFVGNDGVSFIGWLKNYEQLLYTINPGGSGATHSEIHLLNLENNQDMILFKTSGIAG